MKIGLKLVLIISAINLIGIGGLTIAALLFSSSQITSLAYENVGNITEVTASDVKGFLEVPLDEIRALGFVISDIDSVVPNEGRREILSYILRSFIEKNPDFIGVWTA